MEPDVEPPEPPEPLTSSSSGRAIAAGLMVIGLLAGFVAGFLAGQRMAPPLPASVADVPRPPQAAPATEPPAVITESPVVEVPEGRVPAVDVERAPRGAAESSPSGPATSPAAPANQPERPRVEAIRPPADAKPAMLELASRPTGATVYVDDVRVGVTPVTVNDVTPGIRRVRMELPGHMPWTTSVDVEVGAHMRIGASLE